MWGPYVGVWRVASDRERERERRFVKCMADFDAAGRTFILSDFTLSDIKASDSFPPLEQHFSTHLGKHRHRHRHLLFERLLEINKSKCTKYATHVAKP